MRAVHFDVDGCGPLEFEVTAGPTAPFTLHTPGPHSFPSGPFPTRDLRIWLLYTGGAPGSTASGTVSIRAVDDTGAVVGQWNDIPIMANAVARPTAAVVLVLDESGSMLFDAGNNRDTRLQVLQQAATTFIDQLFDDNGVALVSFATSSAPLTDLEVAGPMFSTVRNAARDEISTHGPPNTSPTTSIGSGIEEAAGVYAASPLTSDFDVQAMVVFTDGLENEPPYIADVSHLISDRVYAIGVADAANVDSSSLSAIADNTGGFMLMTGAVTQDDEFLLEKFFLRILAGVVNYEIVVDPTGWLAPGAIEEVPFSICRSDAAFDAIALSRAPQATVMALRTPDGTVVGPGDLPADAFRTGATSRSFRVSLPVVVDSIEHWEGRWQLLLATGRQTANLGETPSVAARQPVSAARTFEQTQRAIPYSALVHARSSLNLRATVDQSQLQPGAQLTVRAAVTEYGQPLETSPRAKAVVRHPDGTSSSLTLSPEGPGVFRRNFVADQSGVYRFRIQVEGLSSRAEAFSREQLLTAAIGHPTRPPDGRPHRPSTRDEICEILACLTSEGVLTDEARGLVKSMGIDLAALQRCLDENLCRTRPIQRPRGQRPRPRDC